MMRYLLLDLFNNLSSDIANVQIRAKKKALSAYFPQIMPDFHLNGVVVSLHKLLYELDGGSEPFHKSLYPVIAMG